jgi:hypothetical protein
MKKIGIVGLALGFLAMGLLPRTVAAQANVVSIDVPFDFMVKDTKLPAGTYTITKVDKMNYRISNAKGDQQVMFSTHTTSIPERAKSFTLVFNVYGDQHYLSKFFHQGMTLGNEIPQTAAEKDLAKKVPVTTKTVTK